jgi:uncharacterized membrane protein YfcA
MELLEPGLASTLFGLGLLGGFLSGLLGIGGGIIMVPLLLYVPPALAVGTLTMKTVAGITSVQSFFGALSGAFGHKRYNRISKSLALALGGSMAAGSLAGSVSSKFVSSDVMLITFALMAIAAAIMMFIPRPEEVENQDVSSLDFSRTMAVAIGLSIGVLGGVIGQGGAFLFIPAMLYLLKIPTRIAIGTALAVGIASSIAVLVGRIGTNQIPYAMSAVLVAGVLIGAQLGSHLSQKTPRKALQRILSVLITVTAIKICYEVLLAT